MAEHFNIFLCNIRHTLVPKNNFYRRNTINQFLTNIAYASIFLEPEVVQTINSLNYSNSVGYGNRD